jgi:hypothetical protein
MVSTSSLESSISSVMRCRHARRHCGQLVVQEGEGIKRRPTEVALDSTRSDALRDHAEPLLSDPGGSTPDFWAMAFTSSESTTRGLPVILLPRGE